MKRITKFSVLALAALISIAGCKADQLSTDQYSDSLTFSAFGPNPVFRGGELTIIGSNLDQVKEVVVPGVDPITDFKVTGSGRECKLSFIVPVDGPEIGKISIVGKNGTILTSLAELTYTEPIVFASFSPEKAMPGDIVTITGDYLNLVQEVIFESGVIKTEFVSRSRYEIKVEVPSEAITGRLIVGDSDELKDPDTIANKIYSEGELTIGDPTVTSLGKITKKAADEIVINGKYLDMIKYLEFEGTVTEEFKLTSKNSILSFTLPETATDGEFFAVSYAGKKFSAGELTTVVPSSLSTSPSPVLAETALKITGKDLDLVTKLEFPNAGEAEFEFKDGKIAATVPATAQEGDIVLSLANGKSVTVAFTLVHPTVTEITPVELTAGQEITLKGTNLHLVTAATLGGKEVGFTPSDDGTSLIIKTDATSVGGKIVLTLANKETIEPEQEIKLNYDSFIITTYVPASVPIAGLVTLRGKNFNMAEFIYVGETKVTSYVSRLDEEVKFYMPYMKVGSYSIKYVLYSGDEETCPTPIQVTLEEQVTVIWQGEEDLGSWSNQVFLGAEDAFANASVGDKVRIYYTPKADFYQFQIFDGHWGATSIAELGGGQTVSPETWSGTEGFVEFKLTATLLSQFYNPQEWGGAMLVQGEQCIVTMVTCTHLIPQEKTIWEGSAYDNWTNTALGTEDDWVNAGLEVGNEIRIYFTADNPADFQIQLFDGHWGAMFPGDCGEQFNNTTAPTAISDGYIHFSVRETVYGHLTDKQYWGTAVILQGNGITFTKIAFL